VEGRGGSLARFGDDDAKGMEAIDAVERFVR
jgi:hypothetical protein